MLRNIQTKKLVHKTVVLKIPTSFIFNFFLRDLTMNREFFMHLTYSICILNEKRAQANSTIVTLKHGI